MGRLENKIVLITGASSGLGRSTALKCATEGAKVYGIGRDGAALEILKAEQPNAVSVGAFDIASPENCRKAVEACISEFGNIDVLINVAGKHNMRKTTDVTSEDWQNDLAVNLSAPFHLSQAAIPHLLERSGNIINVASIAGLQGQSYSAAYCSAKHGLLGLTKALAIEFTHEPLRVNAVCPGGMDTPQVQNMQFPEKADFDLVMRSAAPRGMMDAEQVANVIAFLASDEASAVHGAIYTVDQGKTVG